jgi:hypothetical protein
MKRFNAAAAKVSVRKGASVRGNASTKAGETAGEAAQEKVEEVFVEHVMPKQKPCSLPEDGTPVFRKGVAIRGSLSKLPWSEKFIICLVFSITGTSAVMFVRPALKYLVDHGFCGLPPNSSFTNGPWLFRVLYFAIMWPAYTALLYTFGGLFGRRIWFSNMIIKMWGRLLPKRGKDFLRRVLDVQ